MPISSSKLWIVFPVFPVSWAKNLFLFLPFYFSFISHVFPFSAPWGQQAPHRQLWLQAHCTPARPLPGELGCLRMLHRSSCYEQWLLSKAEHEKKSWRLLLWSTFVFLSFHVALIFPHFSSTCFTLTAFQDPKSNNHSTPEDFNYLVFLPPFQLPCSSLRTLQLHGL